MSNAHRDFGDLVDVGHDDFVKVEAADVLKAILVPEILDVA